MNRAIPLAVLLLAGTRIVVAQPAIDNAPKATNPRNVGGAVAQTPAEIDAEDKRILARRADALKMFAQLDAKLDATTPAQDYEEMRLENEPLLRQKFDQAGFRNLKLQDTVIDFVAAQEKSRLPVRVAAAQVYKVLRNKAANEADVRQSLTAFLYAADFAKGARESATQDLDNAIHFSANLHLEAFLTLNGLIDEASYLTSDIIDLGDAGLSAVAPYLGPSPLRFTPVDPATQTPEQKAVAEKEYLAGYKAGQNMVRAQIKMTAAQWREQHRKTQEVLLRRELASYGVKDLKSQDAIVAFVAAQEKSRARVREAAKAVYLGVEPQGAPISQAEMSARLGKFLAASEQARAERDFAAETLGEAIGLATNTRLMARLTMKGFVGDSSWFTGYVLPTGALSLDTLDVIR